MNLIDDVKMKGKLNFDKYKKIDLQACFWKKKIKNYVDSYTYGVYCRLINLIFFKSDMSFGG